MYVYVCVHMCSNRLGQFFLSQHGRWWRGEGGEGKVVDRGWWLCPRLLSLSAAARLCLPQKHLSEVV
jgi:hypothetical protein